MAKPFTDLTREKVNWCQGDSKRNSIVALKVAIAIAPVLRLPNFELQFVVTRDATDVTVGAILEHRFGSGFQTIVFASCKWNSTEKRYSSYERQTLSIVWALSQWIHYFQGAHSFVI